MPKKTEGYSHSKADARLRKKQNEADIRQSKYEVLSTAEKIALVVKRGGSRKELARLMNPKKKEAPKQQVDTAPKVEVFVSDKKRKGKKQVNRENKENRPGKD